MGKKESVPSRQYTDEFKAEAVRLAGSIGGNPAAERLGIPQSTMAHWVRRSKAGTLSLADASPVKRPLSDLASIPRTPTYAALKPSSLPTGV